LLIFASLFRERRTVSSKPDLGAFNEHVDRVYSEANLVLGTLGQRPEDYGPEWRAPAVRETIQRVLRLLEDVVRRLPK
jgi:hypothetical protein